MPTTQITLILFLTLCCCRLQPYPLHAQNVQVTPSPISFIQPGTIVGNDAPDGWSHLLFKNHSEIGTGDLQAASDHIKHLASFLASAMVAKVELTPPVDANPPSYAIAQIGYGLLAKIDQVEKVISYETYEALGADFGLLDGIALSAAEKRLQRLQISARTATMCLVDAPTIILLDQKHQEAWVRHAVLVDPRSGQVNTLVWFFLPAKEKQPPRLLSDIDLLPPNSDLHVVLHIDRSKFSLGMITEKALALNQMMWGKSQLTFSDSLQPLAPLAKFNQPQLLDLEGQLRFLLQASQLP